MPRYAGHVRGDRLGRDRRARARSRSTPETGEAARATTFAVEGHHYALVHVSGLPEDRATPYEVTLDGEPVWPRARQPVPAEHRCARTPSEGKARIVFGSCRAAAPHEPPYSLRRTSTRRRPRGRRAARPRAADGARPTRRVAARAAAARRPGLRRRGLAQTLAYIRSRRDPQAAATRGSPTSRSTRSSTASRGASPPIRWLLSTVPSR